MSGRSGEDPRQPLSCFHRSDIRQAQRHWSSQTALAESNCKNTYRIGALVEQLSSAIEPYSAWIFGNDAALGAESITDSMNSDPDVLADVPSGPPSGVSDSG